MPVEPGQYWEPERRPGLYVHKVGPNAIKVSHTDGPGSLQVNKTWSEFSLWAKNTGAKPRPVETPAPQTGIYNYKAFVHSATLGGMFIVGALLGVFIGMSAKPMKPAPTCYVVMQVQTDGTLEKLAGPACDGRE